jgi:hypothetical protein
MLLCVLEVLEGVRCILEAEEVVLEALYPEGRERRKR